VDETTGKAVHGSQSCSDLQDVLDAGLPEHPHPDFEETLDKLTEQTIAAQERKSRQDIELFNQAVEFMEHLESELESVEDQVRRLTAIQAELDGLGSVGAAEAARTRVLMAGLSEHRDRLRGIMETPQLLEVRKRRSESRQEKLGELRERIASNFSAAVIEQIAEDLLHLADRDDFSSSTDLAKELERKVREMYGPKELGPIQRFWNRVRKRIDDPEWQERFRSNSRKLREEISQWAEAREANRQAEELCREIHNGIKYIDRLGPEEQIVQMHIWLGKLRNLQDNSDLDQERENKLYMTFGALNTLRKQEHSEHFFDALNRRFTTDWEAYIRSWQSKIEDARERDRVNRKAEEERAEKEAARAKKEALEERRKAETLQEAMKALEEAQDDDEIRDLLELGVESGGCQNDEFLGVAAKYTGLVYGNQFRGLRRSLKRIGVAESEFGAAQPSASDPYEATCADLRETYRGKKVLIIGGLPKEERRRKIEKGLALSELRWYEHYRGSTEHREAEAAIRSGGIDLVIVLVRFTGHKVNLLSDLSRQLNIPTRFVDRGCGITAILKAFAAKEEAVR